MIYSDLTQDKLPGVIVLLDQLREISLKVSDVLDENFYGGKAMQMALYSVGHEHNPTHGISPGKDHVKLYLHHFDKLDLSSFKIEGKGKHVKHIKFFIGEGLDEEKIRKILLDIIQIANKKSK